MSVHLFTSQQTREIDARAVSSMPISGYELMQRAAQFTFDRILQHFPSIRALSVWCGKGNNAGDAYLVAKLAAEFGLDLQLVCVAPTQSLSGDAALACNAAVQAGCQPIDASQLEAQPAVVGEVIVDGLLGTGVTGAPRENYALAIDRINGAHKPVISIDVPSGVEASTGAVRASAVRAFVTTSYITRKIGCYTGPGVSYCGQREFSDLGVQHVADHFTGIELCRWHKPIAELDKNTYKHRRGSVLIVGGAKGMPGAVLLAASAALRVGAGLVTVATDASHMNALVSARPELMVSAAEDVSERLLKSDVVVLGPGLGRDAWGERLFTAVEASGLPTVLDADGLFWLAQRGAWNGGELSITPHSGEAANLLQVDAATLALDRLASSQALAEKYGARVILKGAGTVVTTSTGQSVCAHGNPGMATAGMGDVLSGVVAGWLVPHYAGQAAGQADQASIDRALAQACALHSAAGDAAADRVGELSLIASDVIDALSGVLSA